MQERRRLWPRYPISAQNRVDPRCGKSIIPEVRTLNADSPRAPYNKRRFTLANSHNTYIHQRGVDTYV